MGRQKKILGIHPITKQPLYKKEVTDISNSTVKLRKELTDKFPDIPKITLLHLAVAINLKYPIYLTENLDLLDNKDFFKETYKIQIMQPYELSSIENGVII